MSITPKRSQDKGVLPKTINSNSFYVISLLSHQIPNQGLPVPEMLGEIPTEWEQDLWKRKLCREVRSEMVY